MSDFNKFSIPKQFVGLHAHDGSSVYDGLGYPNQHIDFILENGMNAFALTNHGNMNSAAHAHTYSKKLKNKGVDYRHIYGCEFYFVDSLSEWRDDYEEHRENVRLKKINKKSLKTDDSGEETEGLIIENESESKSSKGKSYPEWKRRYHLVVVAKNFTGLQNLFKLIKKSFKYGFYRFPRIDFKMLKEHSEGLVVSTACVGGRMSGLIFQHFPDKSFEDLAPELVDDPVILNSVMRKLENSTDRFIDAVGKENFFLEIQFNRFPAQDLTNRCLLRLSEKTGIPLIATADSHYCHPDLWEARELYRLLGRMGQRGDDMPELPSKEDLKCELYPKNSFQMWDAFKDQWEKYDFYKDSEEIVKDAIERTHDIAWQMCEEVWFDSSAKLPDFSTPDVSAINQLIKLVKKRMIEHGLHENQEYISRVTEELSVIKALGFENYFLTLTKVFEKAGNRTLLGPGRGSGSGSLVNYILGITHIDPLEYGLLFERFLGLHKVAWPDIDSDVADRDVLIDVSRELFGEDSVIPVSNFNTLKLKSLIKDVSKFYGIPFDEVNAMTNPLEREVQPLAMGDHEEKSTYILTNEDCEKYSESYREFMKKYPKVQEHVKNLFMEIRSIGRHAGGVLVCPNLEDNMPVIKVRGDLQTPWSEGMNFRHLEENGFLKFDFLGLATLKMVEDTIRLILRSQGVENPNFDQINKFFDENLSSRYHKLDDQKVWEYIYHAGRFVQIFQFTNTGARKFCIAAKPRCIEDLSAITAIYRPGPLTANVHRKYVKVGQNLNLIKYDHPVLEEILSESRGFVIYQEQFMLIAQKLSGFDKGASDKMRKTLVKKSLDQNDKKVGERIKLRKDFIDGAVTVSNMDREKATSLYETIEAFSGYGFNKSHAVAYAIDSYYSAWMHTHYEKEWLATCLQTWNGSPKFGKIISEIKSIGYKILQADINTSSDVWVFSEERGGFVPPLTAIKGVGSAAVQEILDRRPFKDIDQLLFTEDGKWKPSKMNKTCFDSLCKVEAFGSLEEMTNGTIKNHRQLHEIIVGNYDLLKKGRHGITKTAAKKLMKETGAVPDFIPEKIRESYDLPDWQRSSKISFGVDLMSGVDSEIIFPSSIMKKINAAQVKPVSSLKGNEKGIAWFCIEEIIEKKTKNGKTFYRLRVCDDNSSSKWVRVWSKFNQIPELYTIWLAEISSNETWGYSTSTYKMKKIDV
jgi:DNA polymerase-3 subunit alpha